MVMVRRAHTFAHGVVLPSRVTKESILEVDKKSSTWQMRDE